MKYKALANIKRTALLVLAVVALAASARPASAVVWIAVSNASQLAYMTDPSGRVYLRNLNAWDSNAQGCCYNYWIDTTTTEGRLIFTIMLADIAEGSSMRFGVPDGYASGAVAASGNW